MELIPPAQIQKGTFLIASPELDSGLLCRAVLLVCEHSASGSFGLIINKPLDLQLPEEVLNFGDIANPHVNMRAAGPVQTNQMMLLHTNTENNQQALKICDDVYLGGDLEFLQQILSDEQGPYIHLCFGYTGWASGQLEREFLDGSWFIYPASKYYLFEVAPDKLWRTLLRNMGGKYATLSAIPDDLSIN